MVYLTHFIKEGGEKMPGGSKPAKKSKYSDLCIEEQKSVDMACMAKSEELVNLCPIFKRLLEDCTRFRSKKYIDDTDKSH